NDHPTSIPTGVFKTRDGHINIASAGDEIFRRLCRALDRSELADDPSYYTAAQRSQNRQALNAAIEAITSERDSVEWIERFNQAGVPAGPIYAINEVFADPQVKHLGIAQAVEHPTLGRVELVGQAVSLSRPPSRPTPARPDPREHTDAIPPELRYGN